MTLQKDPEGGEAQKLLQIADFSDGHVLEIGCGDGRLTWRYAGHARRVTAFDPNAEALLSALTQRPSEISSRITFTRANATDLPFRSEVFDYAILAWSF